jgi:DNA-binding transcriptional ArsR family regulator
MEEKELLGQAFAPVILLGPALRSVWSALYGRSRETTVLNALLLNKRLSLSAIARECGASERSVRRGGLGATGERTGWIRRTLGGYRDAGIVVERREGNRIIYELNEANPAVLLLRQIRMIPTIRADSP